MKRTTTLALVATAGLMTAAHAQQAKSSSEVDSLPRVNLSEVAVVANRAGAKTPIAFTNLSAKEIQRVNNGRDIPYLLQMTPSVVSTSDAGTGIGYSAIRIRGVDASRINVTANGIPVNNSESHNVYWVNTPDLASSLKDVQIQRGVGTSTNGAGAFGASINMISDTPQPNPFASIDASYGSYNTHKETLKAATGLLGGHWAAEMRLSNIGSDGYIRRASSSLMSYFGQVGYYDGPTSLRLIAFGGKERTYMAWDYASKEDMKNFGRRYNPCGEYTNSKGKTAYYPDQFDNYTTHNLQLLFKHRISSALLFDAAIHFTKGDGYYEQYKTNAKFKKYGLPSFTLTEIGDNGEIVTTTVKRSDLVRLKKMDNEFGGGLFNFTYHRDRLDLVAGGALNAYYGRHFGQIAWIRNYVGDLDPLQEYYNNHGRKLDGNIYARASYSLTENLSAYADLQYRHIDYTIKGISDNFDDYTDAMQILATKVHYNFFNPKAGLNYRINGSHRVFASWSTAHKEPTRDNFTDATRDRQPKAERLFDYEIGYNFDTKHFSAGLNLYFMDYKDQLVATGALSDTGNPVSENVSRSYRAGIELQAAWRPVSCFDWTLSTTWSRNRIKDFVEYLYEWEDPLTTPMTIDHGDTPIAFSPDWIVNNSFNFHFRGFDASLQSKFVSRQYLTNAATKAESLDPYFVSDLLLSYSFKVSHLKSLRVGVAVNNLFNAKYESNGYAAGGYFYNDKGEKEIYRYSGFAAQAPVHVLGSISMTF